MSVLFDKSPREDSPKRRGRQKAAPAAEEEPTVSLPSTCHHRPIMGRVDEGVACVDSFCRAECHDITDLHRGSWRLECCFCGTGQWIPAIDGRLEQPTTPASGGEFVFPEGQRGAGCTVAEYYKTSPDYVRWAAANERQDETKKACEIWLASMSAGR